MEEKKYTEMWYFQGVTPHTISKWTLDNLRQSKCVTAFSVIFSLWILKCSWQPNIVSEAEEEVLIQCTNNHLQKADWTKLKRQEAKRSQTDTSHAKIRGLPNSWSRPLRNICLKFKASLWIMLGYFSQITDN